MASGEAFGHFLLPFTMNKGHINAKSAEYSFKVLNRFLELKKDRPERHALGNLLGVLAFRLGDFQRAFEYLDKVLSRGEDPDNLNALANRKYMCEKLLRFPEARDCEQKISKLLGAGGTKDDEKSSLCLRARALAEQAFAYSFELFEETVTVKCYRKSVELYKQATQLAENLIQQDEKEDWTIVKGMASHIIFKHCKWDKSLQDEAKSRCKEAVTSFISIIQSSQDKGLLSDSWRHLGELFDHRKYLPLIPNNLQTYVKYPNKCFEKALSVSPDDPRILARYATHSQRTHKTLEALEKVNKSIRLDPCIVFNQHAYFVRASIRLQQFEKELKASKGSSSKRPNHDMLIDAESDLKMILPYVTAPWKLHSLAKVFYFKATDSNGLVKQDSEGQKNLQTSLTYCAQAVASQDGQKSPEIHKLRGDCLCAMGEHQAALGCFKRAVECDTRLKNFRDYGNMLVVEFEHVLMATTLALPSYSALLSDMFYWLHKVAATCVSNKWPMHSLKNLERLSDHWGNFVKYCNSNGYKTELKTIELAAIDASRRPRYTRASRQYFVPAAVEKLSPTESRHQSRHQSYPGTGATAIPVEEGENTNCAQVFDPSQCSVKTDQSMVPLSPELPVLASEVQTSADTRREAEASGVIYVTYSMDLTTGKQHLVSTIPPVDQKRTTDDVSDKDIRSAPDRPLNRLGFQYDFFVIYTSSASERVKHRLLEELEETGPKGCIKDRDFILGKPKMDNYSESIKSSGCTVVVITKDFETDQHCVRAMLLAMELDRLVIPVLREDRDMPMALRPLTSLNATGAVDWARLQRSIEQQVRLPEVNEPYGNT